MKRACKHVAKQYYFFSYITRNKESKYKFIFKERFRHLKMLITVKSPRTREKVKQNRSSTGQNVSFFFENFRKKLAYKSNC